MATTRSNTPAVTPTSETDSRGEADLRSPYRVFAGWCLSVMFGFAVGLILEPAIEVYVLDNEIQPHHYTVAVVSAVILWLIGVVQIWRRHRRPREEWTLFERMPLADPADFVRNYRP